MSSDSMAAWPKIQAGMLQIAQEDKAAYDEACQRVPALVAEESDPVRFLRFENFDSNAAARRLCNYWTLRKDLFGERAFLPMGDISGNGALTIEDVKVLQTGFLQHLPNDDKGRSVFLFDRSRLPPGEDLNHRVGFFSIQFGSYNHMDQKDGYVCLADTSSPWAAATDPRNFRHHQAVLQTCMPVKIHQIHFICRPPNSRSIEFFLETIVSWALQRARPIFGDLFALTVATQDEDLVEKLSRYGLRKDGLPACFGGTWTGFDTMWQREEENRDFEMNPDVDCLVRNALWKHTQTVEISDYSSDHDGDSVVPGLAEERNKKMSPGESDTTKSAASDVKSCSISTKRSASTMHSDGSSVAQHSGKSKRSVPNRSRTESTSTTSMPGRQERVVLVDTGNGIVEPVLDLRDEGMSLARAAEVKEGEDKDTRRRRRDVIYARRKRERKRIEMGVLEKEASRLDSDQCALKEEGERLESLLRRAKEEVDRYQCSVVLSSLPGSTSAGTFQPTVQQSKQSFVSSQLDPQRLQDATPLLQRKLDIQEQIMRLLRLNSDQFRSDQSIIRS